MSARVSLESTIVAKSGLLSAELDNDLVLLSKAKNLYYGLNETGARVWELIQQPRSVREIHELMLAELDVDSGEWEQDLLALLQSLVDEELAETEE